MNPSRRPIGLFDSGVGGLTVLQTLRAQLPHENIVYFGDSANLPYGTKSPEQIIQFTTNIITWMRDVVGAKLVVAACHTSSGIAAHAISHEPSLPLIWTMLPVLNVVRHNNAHRRLGIIATPASAQNKTHETFLRAHNFDGHIVSIGCPDFVPLIESGRLDGPELVAAATEYLQPFHDHLLDTLIYGCTHYPLIKEIITPLLAPSVLCIDPAEQIATEAHQTLVSNNMLNQSTELGTTSFYCSGPVEEFALKVRQLMPELEVNLIHKKLG